MITQLGYSVAGRSRSQVALCAVCEWFDLKTIRTISHRFGPQNR
jgi:hypothetical protein